MIRAAAAGLALLAVAAPAPARAAPEGYPTQALAEYVFACMATNGQDPNVLQRCSCAIDHIAGRVSYDEYTQAETILRMQQVPGGGRTGMFRSSGWAADMVNKLRQAEAEAEGKCF